MTSLFILTVWPALIGREVVADPVNVAGLSVQSWFVQAPVEVVSEHLANADCLVLPETHTAKWQCLTSEVIYTWDYSTQPSIWSESRRQEEPSQQHISWEGVDIQIDTNRQPLFQLYHQTRKQAESPGARVYLKQQFGRSFVWSWYQQGVDITVSGWRDDEGNSHLLRVERSDEHE